MASITRSCLSASARKYCDQQMAANRPAMPSENAKRVRKGIRDSKADAQEFLKLCERAGVAKPQTEFRFNPERLWRADFCWVREKLLLEVEGAVFIAGGHTRGMGFVEDMEKYNSAAVLGYRIVRCTPEKLVRFETVDLVRRALRGARLR